MRKLLFLLLAFPIPVYAAHAILVNITGFGQYTDAPAPTVSRISFSVAYLGGDVPNNFLMDSVQVAVTSTTTPAQLASGIVTAVQAEAVVKGFTVPVGSTLLPSYASQ